MESYNAFPNFHLRNTVIQQWICRLIERPSKVSIAPNTLEAYFYLAADRTDFTHSSYANPMVFMSSSCAQENWHCVRNVYWYDDH